MFRLEAKEAELTSREKKDTLYNELLQLVKPNDRELSHEEIEAVLREHTFARTLHLAVEAQQEWVKQANEYRKQLKGPDKRTMEKSEYETLTLKAERSKLLSTVMGWFPSKDSAENKRP